MASAARPVPWSRPAMSGTPVDQRFRIGRTRTGLGLIAAVPFRSGQRVIEYTGARISAEEADRRGGRYLFHVDDDWAIDATGRENLARYINHACRPNCEARAIGRRIFIYAKRRIEPGEELNYHYGRVYFRAFIAPNGCRCASCVRRAERMATAVAAPPRRAPARSRPTSSRP
jgi:uncharacterized protein